MQEKERERERERGTFIASTPTMSMFTSAIVCSHVGHMENSLLLRVWTQEDENQRCDTEYSTNSLGTWPVYNSYSGHYICTSYPIYY